MRRAIAIVLIFCISVFGSSFHLLAGARSLPAARAATVVQNDQPDVWFSSEQLENLLAPIALYPDPLLAQVLVAATFPDQIDEADREIRANYDHYDIDAAPWDVSVQSVAHYPTVLHMMADKIDWTTSLGQAYVNQPDDVMNAVQRLRVQAHDAGNLATTPQQEIVDDGGYIEIYPAEAQYIYVPVYDPAIIYFPRRGFYGPVIWFGVGYIIGVWLNHDCDWRHRRVFYHGWEHGSRWIERSRPFIHVSNRYMNNRFREVQVNRHVVDRHVNYDALSRYHGVHPNIDYKNVRRDGGPVGRTGGQPSNQNLLRNINPNDPRIDANRGRGNPPPTQPPVVKPPRYVGPPETQRPPVKPPAYVGPPETQRPPVNPPRYVGPPETQRPPVKPPVYVGPPQTQRPPVNPPRYVGPPETQRPPVKPPVYVGPPQTQRPPNSVFGGAGQTDSRASGQRGYESRQQQIRPAPAPAPAVRPSPPPQKSGPPSQPRGGAGRRP